MSRIGKKLVSIPDGVKVTVDADRVVTVQGPKGELSFEHHRDINIVVDEAQKTVQATRRIETKKTNALWGTMIRLVENMIIGVSQGFEKKLELNGVGFRMNVQGKKLALALGFSHPVDRDIPEGLEVKVEGNALTVSGCDKQRVGQFAAEIRSLKPVEPYKGKGFKYHDEIVRRKEGKKAGA